MRRRIPIRSYPEVVAKLFNNAYGIAVAGTHGKSTTSALLAVTLEALGYDPTALIGAVVNNWHSNARIPNSTKRKHSYKPNAISHKPFVLEADEYRRAFLNYRPKLAIVTSIDWDHPDVFPTATSYHKTFDVFVRSINKDGALILWGDDTNIRKLQKKTRTRHIITYGEAAKNALRIKNIHQTPQGIRFSTTYRKRSLGIFRTRLFGIHNALNAASVIAACLSLNEKPNRIRRALFIFKGTKRRFDILNRNPFVIDDYAHHPEELRVTIATAKETFPKRRIRVLFQPHTYSRTKAFFKDFIHALQAADDIAILKTYGSAREKRGSVRSRSETLAETLSVPHFANHAKALKFYQKTLQKNDVLLVLGAGDGDQFAAKLIRALHKR